MHDDHQRQLLAMFDALRTVANVRRLAVGDGGTQAGIMEAAGQARRTSHDAFLLIGVAPAADVPPRGQTPVDPNHSDLVAVDSPGAPPSDAWGSETETMYWLFGRLAEGRPSVTVVANGGDITLTEVAANVRQGRRMIVVEDSGRAADALISLIRGTTPADAEVQSLRQRAEEAGLAAQKDLYRIVPLHSGAPGLHAAILSSLQ